MNLYHPCDQPRCRRTADETAAWRASRAHAPERGWLTSALRLAGPLIRVAIPRRVRGRAGRPGGGRERVGQGGDGGQLGGARRMARGCGFAGVLPDATRRGRHAGDGGAPGPVEREGGSGIRPGDGRA
jgi:hypothetical protein